MKKLTACIFIIIGLISTQVSAEGIQNKTIERITVNYKSPFDYALYQYTTEILMQFKLEIAADIYKQARAGSNQMAHSIAKQFNVSQESASNRHDSNKHSQYQSVPNRKRNDNAITITSAAPH